MTGFFVSLVEDDIGISNCVPLVFTFPSKIGVYDVPTVKLVKFDLDTEFKVLSYSQSVIDTGMLKVHMCLSSDDLDTHYIVLEYDVQNPHPEFSCIQRKTTPALRVLLERETMDIGPTN